MNLKCTSMRDYVSVRRITKFKASVAEASMLRPGVWWIARVFVLPEHRRQGVGKALVNRLVDECFAQEPGEVIVAPGGYDTEPEVQYAFYKSVGFVEVEPGLFKRVSNAALQSLGHR